MADHDRFHALDAVRGLALLLGLVLHTTMSFFLPVPVADNSPSTTLTVLFFVIHIFRMSVFYFIAGFFAHMVFHRRSVIEFIKDRIQRIGIPMVVGWIVFVPATLAIVKWGLIRTFGAEVLQFLNSMAPGGFSWAHIWFLYYLCLLYLLMLSLHWIISCVIDRKGQFRLSVDKLTSLAMRSCFAPVLLATPICLLLYFSDNWVLWMGIPTPGTGIIPQPAAMIGFGTAFGFGWILHRQTSLLGECRKRWLLNLAIAAGLTVFCLYQVGLTPNMTAAALNPGSQVESGWIRFGYAVAYTMAIWYWTFGIVGAGLRFFSGFSAHRRYLADASYWLYLMHLPVIMFFQVIMAKLPLHWSVKFPIILVITVALGLVSYHYLVRSTFIGKILNGRRYFRKGNATETLAERNPSGLSVPALASMNKP